MLAGSPLEKAFEARGYRLSLDGIARIEMAARGREPRLPQFIGEMDITATRTESGNGNRR